MEGIIFNLNQISTVVGFDDQTHLLENLQPRFKLFETDIFDFLFQYKNLINPNLRCKLPELYDLKPFDLAVAAENGDREALLSIAITLLKGDGVPKDIVNARQVFYKLAYENKLNPNQTALHYYSKILCLQNEYEKGISINEKLVEAGFPPAMALRGNFHEYASCGVRHSNKEAKNLYTNASSKKHIPATFLLAKILFRKFGFRGKLKSVLVYGRAFRFVVLSKGNISDQNTY